MDKPTLLVFPRTGVT